jgi:hypothetical protein
MEGIGQFHTQSAWLWTENGTTQQEDRQCTDNWTSRRARATIVAVEKQYALHIVGMCL